MPTFSLRWFFALVAAFVIVVGADFYLSRDVSPTVDASSQRLEVADFIAAANAGELSAGHIVFRANATGLADLTATRTIDGASKTVRTTARLTDADLAALRERRFAENDAAALAEAHTPTVRERASTLVHITMQ